MVEQTANPVRADIRDEVLGRLDVFAQDIITTIREQIPAYAALTHQQLSEITAIAEWGTTRILQEWAVGGALTETDIQRFKGIGAARALDGRPLPGVLRAYRLAGTVITELVERLGGPRLTVTDAMDLSRLWMASIDTLSEALYAGHTAASNRVSGDRTRALSDLVDDLLIGRQVTRTGLADRSRELGVTLTSRVDLLVLSPEDSLEEITLHALDAFLTELCHDHAVRTLVRIRAGVGIAVVPTDVGDLQNAAGQRQWRGCRFADQKVADLPRAFRLAEHVLDRAPARAFADGSVLDEADAQVVALLTGHGDADPDRLDTLVLSKLRLGTDHLLEGLQAYLDTGSAAEAAHLLELHAQTMRYRLRRIVEVTGRDPRRPWDHLVLEAALLVGAPPRQSGHQPAVDQPP